MRFNVNSVLRGKRACGVNVWIKSDENMIIDVAIVTKKRSRLCISNRTTMTSLDEIKNKISKDIPLYLSVDGKGILNKIVSQEKDVTLIDSVLPNADSNDFYLQEIILSGEKRVVSCIRKERIDYLTSKLNEYGFNVLELILGPFSTLSLSRVFETETSILVPHYKLVLKQGLLENFEINNIDYQSFKLELDSIFMESEYIIPFSNCMYHFGCNANINSDNIPCLQIQNERFRYQRVFRILGWTILITLLTSLWINFLLFDRYSHKNLQLITEIDKNKETLNLIDKLEIKLKTNETIYNDKLSLKNSLISYYIDKIAKEVPLGITLNRLCIFPESNTGTNDKILNFQKDIIIINGKTQNSTQLELWIKTMEKYDWIKRVSISSYSDNTLGPANFDLEILLNEI